MLASRRLTIVVFTSACVWLNGPTLVGGQTRAAPSDSGARAVGSGPFGLRMGMSRDELERAAGPLELVKPNIYKTTRPPRPHDRFEAYYLVVNRSAGLCKIQASGLTIETNNFGTQLHQEFDNLRGALESKYGPAPVVTDRVRDGSLWTEPQYWMMGLLKKDRTLAASWSSLGGELEGIILETKALSTDRGWVTLGYFFRNSDACLEELKRSSNDAL